MRWLGAAVAGSLLLVACGGDAPRSDAGATAGSSKSSKKGGPQVEACSLLTPEEIEAAAGWRPESTTPKTHGTTATCAYHGPSPVTQSVVLIVSTPAPKLANSAAMAAWRGRQAQGQTDYKLAVEPVEGLGAPAIRTQVDGGKPMLEAAGGGVVLSVTAPSFEVAKALAAKAIPRLR
jgi:hypothetical protein